MKIFSLKFVLLMCLPNAQYASKKLPGLHIHRKLIGNSYFINTRATKTLEPDDSMITLLTYVH